MTTEENKAIVRKAWEGVDRGDLSVAGEVYASDCIVHEPNEDIVGVEAVKKFIGTFLEAFPGMDMTIEDMVAEEDKVAARWTAHGIHRGELAGIPASGNEVSISGITIHRIEDGRIAEEWEMPDELGLMVQIGAVPAPEGAEA